MPLGKYYCDYCDKEFQDTSFARKRHLQGVQHQRAKALWYDSLRRDPHHIHPESLGKGVCNRFLRTGSCPYGDSCKYYHPKQNIHGGADAQSNAVTNFTHNPQMPSILGGQLVAGATFPGNTITDSMGVSFGNLPPSLKPPPEGGYPPLPFVDWGSFPTHF